MVLNKFYGKPAWRIHRRAWNEVFLKLNNTSQKWNVQKGNLGWRNLILVRLRSIVPAWLHVIKPASKFKIHDFILFRWESVKQCKETRLPCATLFQKLIKSTNSGQQVRQLKNTDHSFHFQERLRTFSRCILQPLQVSSSSVCFFKASQALRVVCFVYSVYFLFILKTGYSLT